MSKIWTKLYVSLELKYYKEQTLTNMCKEMAFIYDGLEKGKSNTQLEKKMGKSHIKIQNTLIVKGKQSNASSHFHKLQRTLKNLRPNSTETRTEMTLIKVLSTIKYLAH